MKNLFLNSNDSWGESKPSGDTMTLNDLIEHLTYIRDTKNVGKCHIYFRNDDDTYSNINWETFSDLDED